MNEIAASLSVALLRMSLFLAAAAIAVQLLLRLARVGSPRIHRLAWLLVLAQGWLWWRLPVTIPCYEPAPPKQVSSLPETRITVPETPIAVPETPIPLPDSVLPPVQLAREDHPVARRPALSVGQNLAMEVPQSEDRPASFDWNAAVRRNWAVVILGGWAAGMLALAGASILSYLRFLRGLRTVPIFVAGRHENGTVPFGPLEEAWAREWQDLLARHGVGKHVPLLVTAKVGPLLYFGPRGYRLVVPAGLWQRLAPASRLSILRHELAHLARRDLVKSICVRLLMLPHWFNPLAWLAVRRFDEAAEWACDEAAKGTDPQQLPGLRRRAAAIGRRLRAAPVLSRRRLGPRPFRSRSTFTQSPSQGRLDHEEDYDSRRRVGPGSGLPGPFGSGGQGTGGKGAG